MRFRTALGDTIGTRRVRAQIRSAGSSRARQSVLGGVQVSAEGAPALAHARIGNAPNLNHGIAARRCVLKTPIDDQFGRASVADKSQAASEHRESHLSRRMIRFHGILRGYA